MVYPHFNYTLVQWNVIIVRKRHVSTDTDFKQTERAIFLHVT